MTIVTIGKYVRYDESIETMLVETEDDVIFIHKDKIRQAGKKYPLDAGDPLILVFKGDILEMCIIPKYYLRLPDGGKVLFPIESNVRYNLKQGMIKCRKNKTAKSITVEILGKNNDSIIFIPVC